jgi:hypothetical protein
MQQRFLVQPNLPYAGLGNMLLVWARAVVFAEINRLPIQQPNWYNLHIGPWLRQEKCKRYYGSFFHSKGYQSTFSTYVTGLGHPKHLHFNPAIQPLDSSASLYQASGRHVFVFDTLPPWHDYFQDLKEFHSIVKKKLYDYVRPSVLKAILEKPAPEIGIHIRRGDYQEPKEGDDFRIQRHAYTPLNWYVDTLKTIRQVAGWDVPTTIFSDGYSTELQEILELPQVSLSAETSALSDLLTMSRSRLLLGSCHSSFSSWASYLGQCPTLWQAGRADLYAPIFTDEARTIIYEGGFDPSRDMPELLCRNILSFWSKPVLKTTSGST